MITVPHLHEGLLALEEFYRDKKYDVHLRQPHKGWSSMEKGDHKIPFRYDYTNGGFHMDYIPRTQLTHKDNYSTPNKGGQMQRMRNSALLRHAFAYRTEQANVALLRYNTYSRVVAAHVAKRCDRSPMVSQVIHAQGDEFKAPDASKRNHDLTAIWAHHPDDREVRGAKEDLRTKKRKQSRKEFHEDHGHIGGDCPDCEICRMAKGNMRRIMKNYNKVRERRMGYSWVMDTITMSDHSEEGYKYLIVLRDRASAFIQLLPLKYKSEATQAVSTWIKGLRANDLYKRLGYKAVSTIRTDHVGEWDDDCKKWQDAIASKDTGLGVEMDYVSPDRHAQNPAERACGITECVIKAILMQNNLPPYFWAKAAKDAQFLLNRLPLVSADLSIPTNGDRARPIELFTDQWYSRRQCSRELDYYVSVGTPCLVMDTKAKGSTLAPKVRWGIACGMQQETLEFFCPFTKVRFKSKSFTAHRLNQGINYSTFLGLRELQLSQCDLVVPGDTEEHAVVQLPPMKGQHRDPSVPLPVHIYKPTLRDVHEDSDVVDEDGLTHPDPYLVQATTSAPEKYQGAKLQTHIPTTPQDAVGTRARVGGEVAPTHKTLPMASSKPVGKKGGTRTILDANGKELTETPDGRLR